MIKIKTLVLIGLAFATSLPMAGQQVQTFIWQNWDSTRWVNSQKIESAFTAQGHPLRDSSFVWDDGPATWKRDGRTEFTIDPSGKVQFYVIEEWLPTSGSWCNTVRASYQRNSSGRTIEFKREVWQNNSWVNNMRFRYNFDANGYKIKEALDRWNDSTNSWMSGTQRLYTNDANGDVQTEIYQVWQSNQSWENLSRSRYSYSGSAKVTKLYRDNWNGSDWEVSYRHLYTFDANDFAIRRLSQSFSRSDSTWHNVRRTSYTNNSNGLITESIGQLWDIATSGWKNDYKYKSQFWSMDQRELRLTPKWSVFPNPTTNYLQLSGLPLGEEVYAVIYDQKGSPVFRSRSLQLGDQIDVKHLPSGVYHLSVQGASGLEQVPFLKK